MKYLTVKCTSYAVTACKPVLTSEYVLIREMCLTMLPYGILTKQRRNIVSQNGAHGSPFYMFAKVGDVFPHLSPKEHHTYLLTVNYHNQTATVLVKQPLKLKF